MKTVVTSVCRTAMLLACTLGIARCARAADAPPAASPTATAEKVSLVTANWEETQARVAAHQGKIVVLDAWSTACPPCVVQFPNLVQLHRTHGSQGVVCMSLNCDYAGIKKKPVESYREKVLAFLTKQEAAFENILSNVPSDELFEKMDLPAIPAVYVYGRDGKLVKRFDDSDIKSEKDAFTYKDVNALVDELLAKK